MAILEGLAVLAPVLGGTALFVYLARSRARVMSYHDIPTPRINEMTHGEGGA